MSDKITTNYRGVTIKYNEYNDRWVFELRGRERSSDTLKLAKEAIDKPEPKEKKPFTRIDAYKFNYSQEAARVVVTSIAENSYGEGSFWIMEGDDRSKESAYSLYPCTEANTAAVQEYAAITKEINALATKRQAVKDKMQHLKITP